MMGLDLWFREDVRRILAAAREAMESTAAGAQVSVEYRCGFEAGLRTVATGFGLNEPTVGSPEELLASWKRTSPGW
jgi:hypothetical protein